MSSSDSETDVPKRKRGRVNKHLHMKEMEKLARQKGEEFVSYRGTLVSEKTTGPNCNCRKRCMDKFSHEEKLFIIKSLYDGRPKNEDTYLMGLIDRQEVNRHRPSTSQSRQNVSSFKYFAIRSSTRVEVCRKAFGSLHAVYKALQRLNNLLEVQKPPRDMRGKHQNRANKIDSQLIVKIDEHINSFPKKLSHYSATTITYLDASLNVTKMYDLFIDKNPDLRDTIKYEYYLKHFKDNYGYRFGKPQVDVCSTCEDLSSKIKSTSLNDVAKRAAVAEMLVHKRRAKKFYTKLQDIKELCVGRSDTGAIVFDFMQNLPLPQMPVQEMFYLRKLWYYVFNVHSIGNDESVFYTYAEGEAQRGPNEVCTAVLNFINEHISAEVKILHVFSDACAGQNRNHTLTRLFAALTMNGRFDVIHQYYPIRGHSFLPCDRNFAVIKRSVKKFDRLYSPLQYDQLIESAKKRNPPFKVKRLSNNDILDFKNWWPNYFKKTCKDVNKKQTFTISKYRHLEYTAEMRGYIKTFEFIDGFCKSLFNMKKQDSVHLPDSKAYNGKVPINHKKLEDVAKILHYIPDAFKSFYIEILTNPTTQNEESGVDD